MEMDRLGQKLGKVLGGGAFVDVDRARFDDRVPSPNRQSLAGPPVAQIDPNGLAALKLADAVEHRLGRVIHDSGGQKIVGARHVQPSRDPWQH